MSSTTKTDPSSRQTVPIMSDSEAIASQKNLIPFFKKLRGGLLLIVGYLLSPLSFWNDLFFNLPIAYCFGYLCSWITPNLFLPSTIVGYWLSNIVGILMMQAGVLDVVQDQSKRNFKKELMIGIISSTLYSLLILALVYFKILPTPTLF